MEEEKTVSKTNNVQAARSNGDAATKAEVTKMTPDWPELMRQALQRAKEFIHESLRGESAYAAVLDTSSGLLLKALFQLDTAIDEALRHSADPLDRIDGVARAIDLMLRLTRQIDRLGQARQLLLEARRTLPLRAAQ